MFSIRHAILLTLEIDGSKIQLFCIIASRIVSKFVLGMLQGCTPMLSGRANNERGSLYVKNLVTHYESGLSEQNALKHVWQLSAFVALNRCDL